MAYEYKKLPTIHAVQIDPKHWGVVNWRKGKRTTTIKNYCCFPFQASWSVPVGNIIADGKWLASDRHLSTIWVTDDGTINVGFSPPKTGVQTAVSGIPLILEGREITMSEAMAQGWDTSPLYATSHSALGVGDDGYLYYYVFSTTASGTKNTWNELLDIVRQFSCSTVLLGDGGGSTILDIEGRNVIASSGNRMLATLMTF